MLAVVRELAARYAGHRSFAGLALRLSAYGYAQLPGPEWGMDDATIARFSATCGCRCRATGPGRFAARAAFLTSQDHRPLWLQWRADQLHVSIVASRRPWPWPAPMPRSIWPAPICSRARKSRPNSAPRFPRQHSGRFAPFHRHRLAAVSARPALVLLRPERIVPCHRLNAQAVDLEIDQMPEADRLFGGAVRPGSLFFHQPQEARIPSFDEQSPFRPSFTWLVAQPTPSAAQNRRRFVHSLATMDSQLMVDGGWLLSMGQEEALRNLVAAYRRLPAVRFHSAGQSSGEAASQPATFRFATYEGRTYMYAVNDAPFPITARVGIEAAPGCQLQELTGLRHGGSLKQDADGLSWLVELGPHDLVAARLSQPDARLVNPQISLPGGVEPALAAYIRRLGARAIALRTPLPLAVLENPDFRKAPTAAEPIPDWAISNRLGVTVQLDKKQKHGNNPAVRIASNGPVACLVSRSFEPPATGRLSMSVWLLVSDANRQPPLRLALEGKLDGRDYYRFAALGQPQTDSGRRAHGRQLGPIHLPSRRPAPGRALAVARSLRPDGTRRSLGRRRTAFRPRLQRVGTPPFINSSPWPTPRSRKAKSVIV